MNKDRNLISFDLMLLFCVLIVLYFVFVEKKEIKRDNHLIVEEVTKLCDNQALYTIYCRDGFYSYSFRMTYEDSMGNFSVGDTIKLTK